MADTSRIEELRRRVQRDPASIAFAQLAEEYRRAGRYDEAIETCENGLAHHPGYLSARVTLGRSYLETNALDAAQLELKQVLRAAPENLAALRGLAEIHHRRGELQEALAHYRTALEFAHNDPELQHLVEQIAQELEPKASAPVVVDGLSFQEVKDAFLNMSLPDVAQAGDSDGGVAVVDLEVVSTDALPVAAGEEAFPWPEEAADIVQLTGEAPVTDGSPATGALQVEDDGAALDLAPPLDPDPAPDADQAPDSDEAPEAPAEEPLHLATEPPVEAAVSPAVDVRLDEDSANGDNGGRPQVDALERWLETIIAERQRRA